MSSRDRRGFTLLEAVVALTILGTSGVAALEALGGELRAADRARAAYVTSALAQDRLAVLTLLPAADLSPLADSVAAGTFPAPFAAYRWTAGAQAVLGEPDLYEVTVIVTGDGIRQTLSARLYRPPPLRGPR